MGRSRAGRRPGVLALGVAPMLVFAAIGMGLRLSPHASLDALTRGAALDYSRGPLEEFSPLRAQFIQGALGSLAGDDRESGGAAAKRFPPRTPPPRPPEGPEPPHPPTNDEFEDAYSVPTVPFTARTTTAEARTEAGEPRDCATGSQGGTLWYRYRPGSDLGLTANTFGTDHPVALGVFTGPSLSRLQNVGCSTDARGNALFSFTPVPGRTYFFQVAAPVTRGNLVFRLVLQGITTISSISSTGVQGDRFSGVPVISADGRYVGFNSPAGTLVPRRGPLGDLVNPITRPHTGHGFCIGFLVFEPEGQQDVCGVQAHVRDRLTHRTTMISRSPGGAPGDNGTNVSDVSSDGRYFVLTSFASNLVLGDSNRCRPYFAPGMCPDVFVYDAAARRMERVSVSDDEQEANELSFIGSISDDGRYVAFTSNASNLVPGDNNGVADVFVRDREAGTTTLVSVATSGAKAQADPSQEHPSDAGSHMISMSRNGRYVLFRSSASNLVADDTNRAFDVFLRDRVAGTTIRVSVADDESQADGDTLLPVVTQQAISEDGRFALFGSEATNLVSSPPDTNGLEDLFLRDIVRGTTELVTISSSGAQANDFVPVENDVHASIGTIVLALFGVTASSEMHYSMTPDARLVVFSSGSSNLVDGDTNEFRDVFLRDRTTKKTTRLSVPSTGEQSEGHHHFEQVRNLSSNNPTISADGRFAAFHSLAENLVPGDTNEALDIYVHELTGSRRPSGWA